MNKIINAAITLTQSFGKAALVALLCVTLTIATVSTTGCTQPTPANITTAVTDIGNVAGIINASAIALQTDLTLFPASDQAVLAPYITEAINGSALIQALTAAYLASPSSATLAKISAAFSTLTANSAAALLNVAQIKDPNSQAIARGILAAIATSLAILSGYLTVAGAQVTPAAKASLKQIKPYVSVVELNKELQNAKNQGLVPQNATLSMVGM